MTNKAIVNNYLTKLYDETLLKHQTKDMKYNRRYYYTNRKVLLVKMRDYYHKNKNKINRKVVCGCGCAVNRQNLKRHQDTLKCKYKMERLALVKQT